jgi:hypothetical protein
MYHERQTEFGVGIISDKPSVSWLQLQEMARTAGLKNGTPDASDKYFGVILVDEIPVYSYTMKEYPNNAIRCTKMLANPNLRSLFSPRKLMSLVKYASELIILHPEDAAKEGIKCDLTFVSRHPTDHSFERMFNSQGWISSDILYQVGKNPDEAAAWKQIFYTGNIETLKIPSMTREQYKSRFPV